MFIKILKIIISNRFIATKLITICLISHNFLYRLISVLAIKLNYGIHPKHRIIKYKEWFFNKVLENEVVLDIGCNTGSLVNLISDKAKFVYGIDVNSEYIKQAKKQITQMNTKFFHADATSFDYSNCDPIDVILLSNVLEHIEDRANFLEKILKQVKWRTSPKILIRVPMIDRDWLVIYKKELNIDHRLDRTHYTEYSFSSFKNEMDKVNLKILYYKIQWGEIYALCK